MARTCLSRAPGDTSAPTTTARSSATAGWKERRDLLLRSLVVLADQKARGLGSRVLAAAETTAGDLGAARLHLLTTTAERFFTGRGFIAADRESAPPAIRQTREFADLCPASAVYLTKDL